MIKWFKSLFRKKPPMYSILRTYRPEATLGLFLDPMGNHLCVTLERPWLNNQNDVSCIPEGTYHVVSFNSPTKGNVWLFKDVQNRDMIEIHPANWMEQLKGCIAPGYRIAENIIHEGISHRYWITSSQSTMDKLKKILPSSFVLDVRRG